MPSTALIIAGVEIVQDADGRYDFSPAYAAIPTRHHGWLSIVQGLIETRKGPKEPDLSSLYFLQSTKTLAIKIGIARNVAKRIASLARASGYPLLVLSQHTSPTAKRDEKALHAYWKKYRLEGEWFTLPPKMNAQTFVEQSLAWLTRRDSQPSLTMIPHSP